MPNEFITPAEMAKSVMSAVNHACRESGIDEEYFWLSVLNEHPMVKLSARDRDRLYKHKAKISNLAVLED